MSRNQHKWTFCFDIMRNQQFQLMIVNNNFLIDWFENLMKEPSHCSNKWHFIIWNHLLDNSVGFLVHLIHNIHGCAMFLGSLFDNLVNRLLHSRRVENQRFVLFIRSRLEEFSWRSCPVDVWEIRTFVNGVALLNEDIILIRNGRIDILM